jgi:hypothetical protein
MESAKPPEDNGHYKEHWFSTGMFDSKNLHLHNKTARTRIRLSQDMNSNPETVDFELSILLRFGAWGELERGVLKRQF